MTPPLAPVAPPWQLVALRPRAVKWRDLWACDSRQPSMPTAMRGQHLLVVDVPSRSLEVARLLVTAVAFALPNDCRLVGGFVPVTAGGSRVRLVFALSRAVAL